jgi:hypothetical protein
MRDGIVARNSRCHRVANSTISASGYEALNASNAGSEKTRSPSPFARRTAIRRTSATIPSSIGAA